KDGSNVSIVSWVAHNRRGSWSRRRRWNLSLQDFAQFRRVEARVLEDVSMTGAVRAEGGVARAARVVRRVAGRAGGVNGFVVEADPVWVAMRIRLGPAADLDAGDKVLRSRHDRNGMA